MNNKVWIETDGKMELLKREPTKEEYDSFISGLSIMEKSMVVKKEILIGYNNNGFYLEDKFLG